MRSLVTGAGGFAGSHLCDHLAATGCEVFALVRPGSAQRGSGPYPIQPLSCDIRDARQLRKIMEQVQPDRVYHLAAFATPSFGLQDSDTIHDINVCGTGSVCDAMVAAVPEARLLFVSSGEVYGDVSPSDLPLPETRPTVPSTPYSRSKADAETAVLRFFRFHGLHAVIARPFNHTGPRQAPSFVCSGIAEQVARAISGGDRVVRVGNLDVARDFSDVRDIVVGYELLLERGSPGQFYNLASGRATSVRSVAERLCSMASVPLTISTDPARVRPSASLAVAGDASRAKELGWAPRYTLDATLADLLAYWTKQ